MRDCMGEDRSRGRFQHCASSIVESDGGKVTGVWFEPNGKWAHLHVYYDTVEQKLAILYDLQGQEVADLLSAEEMDELARFREAESS
jgi:hypothetical protein